MNPKVTAVSLLAFVVPSFLFAETILDGSTIDISIKPSSPQVSFQNATDGVSVMIKPGPEGYPGITLTRKDGKSFDLSKHGRVEAKIANVGTTKVGVNLRLDNDGDWKLNPYNAEILWLDPGESGVLSLIFGHSYGKKKGFPLKPEAVSRILFFGGKSEFDQSFRIESLVAAGAPGEAAPIEPAAIRTKPANGVLFDASTPTDAVKVEKEPGKITVKPAVGRWDLSDCLQVLVKLKNDSSGTVSPTVRVDSNSGPSDSIPVGPIEAGKSREVVIPFIAKKSWVGDGEAGKKGGGGSKPAPGSILTNDAVSAVVVTVAENSKELPLVVESIKANTPPAPVLPEWSGKRPPVEGDWVVTFDDEFNGDTIDRTKWNDAGPNHWDKVSGFSKNNVIVGGGFAKLRYEHRTLHHNDDPKEKQFQYAVGYLDTYDKFAQRYGYFESRMKLPRAPGLWPAFWMMPDRGKSAGERWKRSDIANGGMEFDLVEHLTRWGPYRGNIAMHWDGYGKDHKAIGSSVIYFQPDKDGFVTAGLLWLPGSAVYYYNGTEVARWETERIADVPEHMMFTMPQGGWDNNPIDHKQLPADLTVDYVRVWQRKDLIAP